jgi:hypothetical protein
MSKFLRIFLLNPNFLLTHRNRYLEGMEDGQRTPRGHPNFNSYVKNLRVLVFQADGRTDRRTDRHLYLIPTWFAFAFYTGIISSGVCRKN